MLLMLNHDWLLLKQHDQERTTLPPTHMSYIKCCYYGDIIINL